MFTRVPIWSQINPVNTTPFCEMHFNIIHQLILGLSSCLFSSGFRTNNLHAYFFSPFVLCALPISSSLLHHSNYTWRRVQVMKLLIMHPSPPSCNFIRLRQNILSTLFSNTLSLCSFLNVRNQVSHPYRTTGKILDSRIEDKKKD
jgi:hypothetical protein